MKHTLVTLSAFWGYELTHKFFIANQSHQEDFVVLVTCHFKVESTKKFDSEKASVYPPPPHTDEWCAERALMCIK